MEGPKKECGILACEARQTPCFDARFVRRAAILPGLMTTRRNQRSAASFPQYSENSDAAEIAKFEASAHRWWDPDGESRPLHELNPVRARYVEERANLRGARVLDVGCGGGLLSEALAREGAQVTAIDLAPSWSRSRACMAWNRA